MKAFTICKWINTRTYKLNSGISISFIEDIKKQIIYILKKEISQLWEMIVETENYNEVFLFAKKHNLTKELDDFIAELYNKNILEHSNSIIPIKNKYLTSYINKNDKNYNYFEKIKYNLLIHNNFLSVLYLDLNYKCNLNCKHCCNPKDQNQFEIDFENAKKIIDEAYELGLYTIFITGGECTINKDFFKIVQYAKHKHLDIIIKTNGQVFYDDKNLLNAVEDLYPSEIDISIYSLNPQIHDYITSVKGSLYKSLEVIRKFKKNNINISITYIMLSYNKKDKTEVEEYAKELKTGFICDHKFIYNKKNNNLNVQLDKPAIENIYIGESNNLNYREKFKRSNNAICPAGFDRLSIAPNLDIQPCHYFNYPLGNYKNNTLKEIKEKIVPEFRKKFITSNLKECFKYDYCEYCVYCPIYSIYDRGFMKKSDTLCQDAKAYKKALLQKNNI